MLLLTFDLLGTLALAISGAAAGVNKRLDLLRMTVLAVAAGTTGGLARDVLIGAVPPAAITNWRYLAASVTAVVATFLWYPSISRAQGIVLLFDGVGLTILAVAGTLKALAYNVHPGSAALVGILTGMAGGILRDVLSQETPVAFRGNRSGLAAVTAAAIVAIGHVFHWPVVPTVLAGASVCLVTITRAARRGWKGALPPYDSGRL